MNSVLDTVGLEHFYDTRVRLDSSITIKNPRLKGVYGWDTNGVVIPKGMSLQTIMEYLFSHTYSKKQPNGTATIPSVSVKWNASNATVETHATKTYTIEEKEFTDGKVRTCTNAEAQAQAEYGEVAAGCTEVPNSFVLEVKNADGTWSTVSGGTATVTLTAQNPGQTTAETSTYRAKTKYTNSQHYEPTYVETTPPTPKDSWHTKAIRNVGVTQILGTRDYDDPVVDPALGYYNTTDNEFYTILSGTTYSGLMAHVKDTTYVDRSTGDRYTWIFTDEEAGTGSYNLIAKSHTDVYTSYTNETKRTLTGYFPGFGTPAAGENMKVADGSTSIGTGASTSASPEKYGNYMNAAGTFYIKPTRSDNNPWCVYYPASLSYSSYAKYDTLLSKKYVTQANADLTEETGFKVRCEGNATEVITDAQYNAGISAGTYSATDNWIAYKKLTITNSKDTASQAYSITLV